MNFVIKFLITGPVFCKKKKKKKERLYRYIGVHVKFVLSDFNPNQTASTNCSRNPKCESSQKSSCLGNCVECGGIDRRT